jgi:hypothetical protein
MSTYAVFFEPTAGWVAAEAIEFHIEGMRIHGEVIPQPTPHLERIEVSI